MIHAGSMARSGAVAQLAKAPVSKTGDSRFESWLPRLTQLAWGVAIPLWKQDCGPLRSLSPKGQRRTIRANISPFLTLSFPSHFLDVRTVGAGRLGHGCEMTERCCSLKVGGEDCSYMDSGRGSCSFLPRPLSGSNPKARVRILPPAIGGSPAADGFPRSKGRQVDLEGAPVGHQVGSRRGQHFTKWLLPTGISIKRGYRALGAPRSAVAAGVPVAFGPKNREVPDRGGTGAGGRAGANREDVGAGGEPRQLQRRGAGVEGAAVEPAAEAGAGCAGLEGEARPSVPVFGWWPDREADLRRGGQRRGWERLKELAPPCREVEPLSLGLVERSVAVIITSQACRRR